MEFSWLVAAITFLAMVIEAVISYKEETFWRSQRRHVHMTFLWNWAISVGGLVILPIVNAIMVSQLRLEGMALYRRLFCRHYRYLVPLLALVETRRGE